MAARSFAALGRTLTSDAVFCLLPPLAQLAWLKLAAVMTHRGMSVLRFGSYVLSAAEVATLAGVTEPEWETYMPLFLRFELLSVEEDDAIACPVLAAKRPRASSDRRAAASRLNGCKGGRPRKRPDPAQREALMPITGGQVAASARPELAGAETCQVSQVSPAIAKLEYSSTEAKLAVSQADVQRVGHAAAAAAGLEGQGHFGAVGKWLTAGATEELIVSTIEAKRARGYQAQHLGGFTGAIMDALAKQPDVAPRPSTPAFTAWEQAYQDWAAGGRVGPMPVLGNQGSSPAPSVSKVAKSLAFDRAVEEWQMGNRMGPIPHPSWFDDQGRRTERYGHSAERWAAYEGAAEQWKSEGCRGDRPLPLWFRQTGERLAA